MTTEKYFISLMVALTAYSNVFAMGKAKPNQELFLERRKQFGEADTHVVVARSISRWTCTISSYSYSIPSSITYIETAQKNADTIIVQRSGQNTPVTETFNRSVDTAGEVWKAEGMSTLSNQSFLRQIDASQLVLESTMTDNGGIVDQVNCHNSKASCFFGPSISDPNQRVGSYELCTLDLSHT